VAADAAGGAEHIARVYTAHDLATGAVQQDAISRAFTLSFYGPRSGDAGDVHGAGNQAGEVQPRKSR